MNDKVKVLKKIPEVPLKKLETLWMQVGGTLCNLAGTLEECQTIIPVLFFRMLLHEDVQSYRKVA